MATAEPCACCEVGRAGSVCPVPRGRSTLTPQSLIFVINVCYRDRCVTLGLGPGAVQSSLSVRCQASWGGETLRFATAQGAERRTCCPSCLEEIGLGGRCRQTPPHPESEDVCRRPCAGTRGRDVPERREPQKGDPSDPWLTPEVCRACGCEGPGQRTTAGSRFQRLHCRVTVLNLRREVRGLVNISGFSLRPWKGHI